MKIYDNIDLTNRNSFHVRQKARRLIEFEKSEELNEIFANGDIGEWRVLGGGNNILFTQDFEGTLIVPKEERIEVIAQDTESLSIRVGAAREWDEMVEWCVEHELWGVENLSLIPGKVGAAPVQNIGAYGAEAADVITRVGIYRTDLNVRTSLSAAECNFGYRESIFKHELKGRAIITYVELRLSKIPQPRLGYGDVIREVEARGGVTLRNIRDAVCSIRRSKLPDTAILGNAGSFFKNPVVPTAVAEALKAENPDMPLYPTSEEGKTKLAAGWLIDRSGLKGYTEGRVGIHDKQALVVVNIGGATGEEVIAFARKVQQKVKERFGLEIETEVNIL